MATIGIKIANGEFYSILEENSSTKKRLVLTTAHDKQHSVQVDLYKSDSKTMADALHICSLVVENIEPKPKGEASVELTISSDYAGNISVEAADMDSSSPKEHASLSVSLTSLEEADKEYEIPDSHLDDSVAPDGLFEKPKGRGRKKKPGLPW